MIVKNRAASAPEKFQCSSASRKFLNKRYDALRWRANFTFQCSSASRKFLNVTNSKASHFSTSCFSALQRAENSSMQQAAPALPGRACFSALQRAENSSIMPATMRRAAGFSFSALQRAENSSIDGQPLVAVTSDRFSALQRAENSSMLLDVCGFVDV